MIAADSTSYPTHAVIEHHVITDGDIRQAVWGLSEAIFKFFTAATDEVLISGHPMNDFACLQGYRNMMRVVERVTGTREAGLTYAVAEHLVDNHRRSVTFLRATANKK